MLIIGCDFHTRYQQIAILDTLTGELTERRLDHKSGEAHAFTEACQDQCAFSLIEQRPHESLRHPP